MTIKWSFDRIFRELEERMRMRMTQETFAAEAGISMRAAKEILNNSKTSLNEELLNKLMHYFSWRLQRVVRIEEVIKFEWDEGWRPAQMPDLAPPLMTKAYWKELSGSPSMIYLEQLLESHEISKRRWEEFLKFRDSSPDDLIGKKENTS